jgi:hypothetical protein
MVVSGVVAAGTIPTMVSHSKLLSVITMRRAAKCWLANASAPDTSVGAVVVGGVVIGVGPWTGAVDGSGAVNGVGVGAVRYPSASSSQESIPASQPMAKGSASGMRSEGMPTISYTVPFGAAYTSLESVNNHLFGNDRAKVSENASEVFLPRIVVCAN